MAQTVEGFLRRDYHTATRLSTQQSTGREDRQMLVLVAFDQIMRKMGSRRLKSERKVAAYWWKYSNRLESALHI